MFQARPSSDMASFREHFAKAKHIVVLTGAGVSAESGVPTFRGAGGYWRTYQAQVRPCLPTVNVFMCTDQHKLHDLLYNLVETFLEEYATVCACIGSAGGKQCVKCLQFS